MFQRIESKEIYGEKIYLGYSYCIGGVLQDSPHEDKAEDFEDIDKPSDENPVEEEQ